jgi:hypothetical protein
MVVIGDCKMLLPSSRYMVSAARGKCVVSPCCVADGVYCRGSDPGLGSLRIPIAPSSRRFPSPRVMFDEQVPQNHLEFVAVRRTLEAGAVSEGALSGLPGSGSLHAPPAIQYPHGQATSGERAAFIDHDTAHVVRRLAKIQVVGSKVEDASDGLGLAASE